jgi:hypothetical protein
LGAKPAPPPPLPPVCYQIQYWDIPTPIPTKLFGMNTMNNLGQIVSWYVNPAGDERAYLYDPLADRETARELAVDLETEFAPMGIPNGCKIASAVGINNHGLIVGAGVSGRIWCRSSGLCSDLAARQVVTLPNWHAWVRTMPGSNTTATFWGRTRTRTA